MDYQKFLLTSSSMKRNDVEIVNEDERVIVHSFEKVLLYPAIPALYTVSPKTTLSFTVKMSDS